MALELNDTYKGISVTGAYFRVLGITSHRQNGTRIEVAVFQTVPSEEDKNAQYDIRIYHIDGFLSGDSSAGDDRDLAYTHLKTLDEFADATDV